MSPGPLAGACEQAAPMPRHAQRRHRREHTRGWEKMIRKRAARSLLPVALSRLTVRRSRVKGHFDHSSTASIIRSRTNPGRTQCHDCFGTHFTYGETAGLKVLFRAQPALRPMLCSSKSSHLLSCALHASASLRPGLQPNPPHAPLPPRGQARLFCRCGSLRLFCSGFCSRCYWREAHSRRCFAGHRDTVLDRDRRRCRSCGSDRKLVVHHRRPGILTRAF